MNRKSLTFNTLAGLLLFGAQHAQAQFAAAVMSYDPGTDPAAGYTDPSTTLGLPERFTGEGVFPGAVTVFNPAFGTDELVSIGATGELTLQLSHFVVPDATGPEIGVFTNVGIADEDFPNGQAGNPLFAFGVDEALVEVSEDGSVWQSLGLVTFDLPTQGYNDAGGTVESDFFQPFPGMLADFDGLPLIDPANPDILELLAGSGGGKWLDIEAASLARVGYIRFAVPAGTNGNFELDAVTLSASATAGRVPEPHSLLMLAGVITSIGLRRRNVFPPNRR